jgi:calcium-dependent protein kinase
MNFSRCVALSDIRDLGRGVGELQGLQQLILNFKQCPSFSDVLQIEWNAQNLFACLDLYEVFFASTTESITTVSESYMNVLDRERENFDVGGLKGIVANRASERMKTASSNLSAKLDRVSGLANQRIIGSYSVLEDYNKEKVVGIGASGKVWKARLLPGAKWTAPQKDVVLKSLKKQGLSDKKLKKLITECEVGLLIDHPLICRLLRVYDSPQHVTLVLEYCDGGDLFDRLARAGPFTEKASKLTCVQMLTAIKYLRAQHVVHRDLKLENWLYATNDPRSPVCLTDFGLATYFDQEVDPPLTAMMGSLYYIAPEVLSQSYGIECDIWATGIIGYMLLSGIAPFIGSDPEDTFAKIMRGSLNFPGEHWKEVSQEAKDFLMRVLTRDVKKRLSPAAALEHVWLKELHDRRFKMTADVRNESMEMLLNLAKETDLRRNVMTCIGGGAQTKTYREARRQFLDLDLENTRTITQKSFVELCKAQNISTEESMQLFQNLDISDHKELSYSEFLAAYLNLELVEDDDAILRAFLIFDVDRDGYVSKSDLETVFANKDCKRMLEEVGCRYPEGMDLRHFKSMVLQPAGSVYPPANPMKRIQLEDNDIGGGWEVKKRNTLRRTSSMHNAELRRTMSMVSPEK